MHLDLLLDVGVPHQRHVLLRQLLTDKNVRGVERGRMAWHGGAQGSGLKALSSDNCAPGMGLPHQRHILLRQLLAA